MKPRIGFACKWIDPKDSRTLASDRDSSTGRVTLSWLNRQDIKTARTRLEQLVDFNLDSCFNLVSKVARLDPMLRMVRLSSEILPVFTEPTWKKFYNSPEVIRNIQTKLERIGTLARTTDTRISFHPGQFTVLASDNPITVERSLEEFEYHARLAEWLGYGKSFQDIKINVHIAGRLGAAGILAQLPRLSNTARNSITIENEEMSYGLDDCLKLARHIPIVVDLHHHWIHTGSWLSREDPRIEKIIASWRGRRPVAHYSQSREDLLLEHSQQEKPDYNKLISKGFKKAKLRAHSDFFWNRAVNSYAIEFLRDFDLMCESKAKNLASFQLYQQYLEETKPNNTSSVLAA